MTDPILHPPDASASRTAGPATHRIRREWKGELGRPVFRVQFGVGFGARQTLADLVAEMADFGGGAMAARNPALRVLRAALEAGGALDEATAEAAARPSEPAPGDPGEPPTPTYRTRPSIVGHRVRPQAAPRPVRAQAPWPVVRRDLVEHQLLLPEGEGARFVLNPRIALQLAAEIERLPVAWRQVTARAWAGEVVTFERGGRPGESHLLRDLVARLFEFAGAAVGEDRHACWTLCRRLIDTPHGDTSVLIFGLPREAEVEPAIERLQHSAIVEVDSSGGYRFAAPAHDRFVETVRFLDSFAAPPRA